MRWGRDDNAIRQRIGISLQETKLTDKLTVAETVRLFRSFYDCGPEPEAVVEWVSLTDKAGALVEKLSGGQKQRLAVACSLVGDPELLFLDEPTTGLDPQSRREIWKLVRDHRTRGGTTLLTTHYMDEAERLCDRVAVVDLGKVIALGTSAELIAGLGGEHVIEFAVENGAALPKADSPVTADLRVGRDPVQDAGLPGVATMGPPPGPALDALRDLPSVRDCHVDHGSYSLTVAQPHVCLPALLECLRAQHFEMARLTTRHASLEDVFVSLTGRHLTDE